MDFADLHPESQVTATDLSAIQPQLTPMNLCFEVDDAEEDWQFGCKFDYIHIRSMSGSIADWPRLLSQAYDYLNPGGWIEFTEFEAWAWTDDGSLPESSAYQQYQVLLDETAREFGKDLNIAPKLARLLGNAGFTDVVSERQKVPLSPWPTDPKMKIMGQYMQLLMFDSLEAYTAALFTRILNWTNDMIQAQLALVRADLKNLDYHMYSIA